MKRYLFICSLLLLTGCHSLQISDEQIEEIVNATQNVVAKTVPLVTPVVDPYVPGASGGIAVVLAAAIAALVRWGLKALQKKKTDTIVEAVTQATRGKKNG